MNCCRAAMRCLNVQERPLAGPLWLWIVTARVKVSHGRSLQLLGVFTPYSQPDTGWHWLTSSQLSYLATYIRIYSGQAGLVRQKHQICTSEASDYKWEIYLDKIIDVDEIFLEDLWIYEERQWRLGRRGCVWTGDCNGKVSSSRPSALNTSVSGLILLLASQHFITLDSIQYTV